MNGRLRWSLISAAAVATGVATFVAPEERKPIEPAAPSERPAEVIPAAIRQQPAPVAEWPRREPIGRAHGDLFAARSWAPPPASPQAEEPKPPPNPYRFIGTADHDGARRFFLALGERVFEVKPGEKLDQGFRVQSVTP